MEDKARASTADDELSFVPPLPTKTLTQILL